LRRCCAQAQKVAAEVRVPLSADLVEIAASQGLRPQALVQYLRYGQVRAHFLTCPNNRRRDTCQRARVRRQRLQPRAGRALRTLPRRVVALFARPTRSARQLARACGSARTCSRRCAAKPSKRHGTR
jgi:hypothetical protein